MLKRIRSAWWAVVALALFAGVGYGQQVVDGQTTAPVFTKIGGMNMTDSTGVIWRFDANGYPYVTDADRDRDFPLITNLFAGQQLTRTQTYSMTTAVPMMQYTRAAIMLTWAAAAVDTDSVRIAVRVYGTTSPTSANWHLWTPQTTFGANDTCVSVVTPAAAETTSVGRCLKPVSFWVTRKTPGGQEFAPLIMGEHASLYEGAAATSPARIRIRKIPAFALRYASANAVMLNLTDTSGAPCPFPYIRIEVQNASGPSGTAAGSTGTLTNVQADLWPRVQ